MVKRYCVSWADPKDGDGRRHEIDVLARANANRDASWLQQHGCTDIRINGRPVKPKS